ncbi:MAG: hypothetical protein MRY63_09015 [Neomegalonema sp.]|nr:hypothetical protein [Neomegalonema sp.]
MTGKLNGSYGPTENGNADHLSALEARKGKHVSPPPERPAPPVGDASSFLAYQIMELSDRSSNGTRNVRDDIDRAEKILLQRAEQIEARIDSARGDLSKDVANRQAEARTELARVQSLLSGALDKQGQTLSSQLANLQEATKALAALGEQTRTEADLRAKAQVEQFGRAHKQSIDLVSSQGADLGARIGEAQQQTLNALIQQADRLAQAQAQLQAQIEARISQGQNDLSAVSAQTNERLATLERALLGDIAPAPMPASVDMYGNPLPLGAPLTGQAVGFAPNDPTSPPLNPQPQPGPRSLRDALTDEIRAARSEGKSLIERSMSEQLRQTQALARNMSEAANEGAVEALDAYAIKRRKEERIALRQKLRRAGRVSARYRRVAKAASLAASLSAPAPAQHRAQMTQQSKTQQQTAPQHEPAREDISQKQSPALSESSLEALMAQGRNNQEQISQLHATVERMRTDIKQDLAGAFEGPLGGSMRTGARPNGVAHKPARAARMIESAPLPASFNDYAGSGSFDRPKTPYDLRSLVARVFPRG